MLSHPMTRARRALLIATLIAAAAGAIAACGEEGIDKKKVDTPSSVEAAVLFDERCSGCHTLSAAGTQGSATNVRTREYKDGPNFDQRHETKECVLYAIRNGGFSSGPMPQDIVTGPEAEALADFVAAQSKKATGNEPDCPPG
jgi:mono/diheme cytochrome c family protein